MKLSRRRFLQASAVGAAAAATQPRLAFAAPGDPGRGDALVFLFLRGGMDGLSAVIPAHEPLYYDRRPNISIPEALLTPLQRGFGLHPGLAPLADLWSDGQLAVVPACGHASHGRSHFDCMERIELGQPDPAARPTDGVFSRVVSALGAPGPGEIPAAGIAGRLPRSLQRSPSAVAISDPGNFRIGGFPDPTRARDILDRLYTPRPGNHAALGQAASGSLAAVASIAAANPSQYAPANGAVYPESGIGRSLRRVAQLLRTETDLRLRLATLDVGGWDTHNDMGDENGGRMLNQLSMLGSGLRAFAEDIQDLLGEVTILVMAEFGRQVHENGNGGCDHGNGGVAFAIGGGIRGGVHGSWPGLDETALIHGNGLAPVNDYRNVFAEIFVERMGLPDPTVAFPGLSYQPLGLTFPS